jgi:hypothetical protein
MFDNQFFPKTLAEMSESSSSYQAATAASGAAAGAGGLIIILIILYNSPGMLILSILKEISLKSLDRGQMWVFSILSSLALLFSLKLSLYNWGKAFASYLVLCLLIAFVTVILYFGFKVDFAIRSVHHFF